LSLSFYSRQPFASDSSSCSFCLCDQANGRKATLSSNDNSRYRSGPFQIFGGILLKSFQLVLNLDQPSWILKLHRYFFKQAPLQRACIVGQMPKYSMKGTMENKNQITVFE